MIAIEVVDSAYNLFRGGAAKMTDLASLGAVKPACSSLSGPGHILMIKRIRDGQKSTLLSI